MEFPEKILKCLKDPKQDENTDLVLEEGQFRCHQTENVYSFEDGIARLYAPETGEGEDITSQIKSFYEINPFPDYDGLEEFGELVSKGYENKFAHDLINSIGYNKLILECGCGTGQMTHFLQLNNNHTLGVDLSLPSLALAVEHKRRNKLKRAHFAQMNLFRLGIKDASFDVVISHGVLHHTYDAKLAFSKIVRKTKPGGIIILGLYNSYARIPTWIRSKLINCFGPNIDKIYRDEKRNRKTANTWIQDQYFNPHETWHSIKEAMEWFDENEIEFLNCYPSILRTSGENSANLFSKSTTGGSWEQVLTQLSWIWKTSHEGGLFDLIGRKT